MACWKKVLYSHGHKIVHPWFGSWNPLEIRWHLWETLLMQSSLAKPLSFFLVLWQCKSEFLAPSFIYFMAPRGVTALQKATDMENRLGIYLHSEEMLAESWILGWLSWRENPVLLQKDFEREKRVLALRLLENNGSLLIWNTVGLPLNYHSIKCTSLSLCHIHTGTSSHRRIFE